MPGSLIERWNVQKYCDGFPIYGSDKWQGLMLTCNNSVFDYVLNVKEAYTLAFLSGGPISPDCVNNMLKRVLTRAGIPKVRFHDLRHTFATIALQNGVDIKTVSGMLGHFSAGFTLDTYAHVTTAAQKEAAETMEQVLTM